MLQTLKTIPAKIPVEITHLTDWLKYDDPSRQDYAKKINEFKSALGLPLEHIRTYSPTEKMIWELGLVIYGMVRHSCLLQKKNLSHRGAVNLVKNMIEGVGGKA